VLLQLALTGAVLGCFYALIALGYTVIYGTIRLINFAHGDVYMLGGFIGFTILGLIIPTSGVTVRVVASVAGTIAATGLVGYIIRWLLARLKARSGSFSPIIAAVGVSLVIQNGVLHVWGSAALVYPVQLPPDLSRFIVTLVICCLLLFAAELWIGKTKFGAAMRAVGIDHGAVRLMGISVDRVLYITFVAFSAIAGVTGYLAGSYYGVIEFLMGFELGLKGFTAAVLGGIGNVRGALVGGFVLGMVESFGGGWLGTQWTSVIAFSVLIALLILKPTGILGETVVERM
jgi:branched-chain amino acid transport system permease protein